MSFQSRKHQLVFHPTKETRLFYNGKIGTHETICIRNPYEFTILETDGVCYLNYRGLSIQVKETIEEIAGKYDDFMRGFEDESREVLYGASSDALSMMM